MTQQLKTTALYCRLSKDDERQGESLSIETQKSMLVRYAQENGLLPYEIYVDDGYSGLNFERPSFQRMIDDVAVGEIGVVVVKDLSRFGRDHIVVGQYQEIYFPSKKVRFIALNDGIDTVNSHTTDYAALKNVINEFYSRDTSRKIKAAFRARAKDGKYHAKAAPFGYLKDPNDHNHLIPDPETAPIVAKIYDLVLKGWGNYRIRDYLRETKVPVPSWYQHIRGVEDKSHMFPDEDSKYIWRPDTLRLLIRNRVYCGDCVLCKSDTIFKTKQHFKTDEKEWITVENTHEAIVSREIWERANELIAVKRREYRKALTGDLNIFSGLLKCADCGKALSRRKYGSNSGHMIYVCGTYATYGSHKCTQHKIFEEDLTAVDPAFQAGQTIRLTGSQAEKFVRARMVLENDTNLARMKRQRAYMDSFQACARAAINTDSEFTMKLLEKLGDFLQSDMTAQQLSDLVTRLDKGTVSPIRYADGELLLGERYYEFYPDEASLWEIVKAACCE